MQNNTKKASVTEILRNVLDVCHGEGLLAPDGTVDSDVVFRRFTAEVFRQYRQDVRLREFQALMGRSSFVTEAIPDQKQYRINVEKVLAERKKKEPVAEKKEAAEKEAGNSNQERKPFNMNPFLSSLEDCCLIDDETYLEKISTGVEMTYAITVSRPMDPGHSAQGYSCLICRENFRSAMGYLHHISTHGQTLTIQESAILRRTKSALNVTLLYDEYQLMSTLKLANPEGNQVIVNGVYIYHKQFELFPIDLQEIVLEPGESRGFLIQNRLLVKSPDKYSLLITYRRGGDQWDLLEQHYLRVYEVKDFSRNQERYNEDVITPGYLGKYLPPKDLCTLAANNFEVVSSYTPAEKKLHDDIRAYYHADPKTRLNASNYCQTLELLTHIQDLKIQCDLAQYRAEDATITPTQMQRLYRIDTAHFTSLPVNLAEGDIVQLTIDRSGDSRKVQGTIAQILYDHIVVELDGRVQADCRYKFELQANRLVCRLELNALDIVRRHELAPLFFPSEAPKKRAWRKVEMITAWVNCSMADNVEQQTAVRNILNRVSDPLPYIVFGPPGTGKTTTIVEAIVQICSHHPTARILVAAQSNAACDEVAIRLMKHLAPKMLFRIYSRSAGKRLGEIPENLQQISNLAGGTHRWPTWEEVYKTKILICSLSICGRLVQSRIRSNHFRYVFIDECGSASEPAALTALAGMVSSRGRLNASVVLAGDPYQLGPVIRSELAAKMGLGMSMLERLMNLPVYQKDPITKLYNTQLITKLVKNYRSHEALIKFSNEQFYDGELQCLASSQVSLAENWRWLPNKTFPIILHTVFGSNKRSQKSKSFMNQTEIDTVEFYLDFLLKTGINDRKIAQEDIGIISPYQLQVQRLKQMCQDKQWPSLEIGSVEQFQGREKLVIILSTARSHTPDVGFLNNVKRLNVALTRAKALLIVIGNSNTLQTDPNWYEFIKYCTTKEAIVGRCFGLDAKRIVERTNRDARFDALFNVLV